MYIILLQVLFHALWLCEYRCANYDDLLMIFMGTKLILGNECALMYNIHTME